VSIEEIEKQLQAIEMLESYSRDEQAEVVAGIIARMVASIPREQLANFFKQMILNNPDILDYLIDFFKTRLLKEYREAVKLKRREIKIKRV
jgi:hypothetical protein